MAKLKYIGNSPIFLPELKNYKQGIALPNSTNIIDVTENELKHLLRYGNFTRVISEKKKEPEKEV